MLWPQYDAEDPYVKQYLDYEWLKPMGYNHTISLGYGAFFATCIMVAEQEIWTTW